MISAGTVYLVGAGPGDPDLLTVKALRLLREAQVVVYDRLANPMILKEAPLEAERVNASKGPNNHVMKQEDINNLLVRMALEGKTVIRLKGGDPFLFGRGGEEADVLFAAGIPFEVVPGVSSAIAVPAYAGIPVTDRRYSASLRVITGQRGSSGMIQGRAETVVALMSVKGFPQVVEQLLSEGWPVSTPVAMIERGTTPDQRTVTATLADAVETSLESKLQSPSVIVVGDVVTLHSRIGWWKASS